MRRVGLVGTAMLGTVVVASLAAAGSAALYTERSRPRPVRDPKEAEAEIVAAAQAKRLRKQAKRLSQ